MGFTPPVPQNESDWEIRAALLLSLALQVLLIFVGPVRRRSSSPLPRFAIWACYLLADWVADLGLGLLLNNLGNIGGNGGASSASSAGFSSPHLHLAGGAGLSKRGPGGGGGSPSTAGAGGGESPPIFAFWTPFLLLHLGGPDTITAYSLEDNELWLRHLIGLLFELFSAFVVFFCSLRRNPMIPATVLVFVAGIIKYAERTFSLYSGSVAGFRNNMLDEPNPGPNYAKLMTEFNSKKEAGLVVEIVIPDGAAKKAQEELEKSEEAWLVTSSKSKSVEAQAYDFFQMFRLLFVNLILSFKERRISQAYFLDRDDVTATRAFQVVEVELNFIYDMVYTKAPVAHTKLGCALRFLCSACLVSATVVFALLDKTSLRPIDRGITYALLLGGLALDAAAFAMLLTSNRMLVLLEESDKSKEKKKAAAAAAAMQAWLAKAGRAMRPRTRRWSEKTSQLNLISYCLGKPDDGRWGSSPRLMRALTRAADALRVREVLDDFIFIRRMPLHKKLVEGESVLLRHVFNELKKLAQQVRDSTYKEMREACDSKNKEMWEKCGFRGEGFIKSRTSKLETIKVDGGDQDEAINLYNVLLDSIQEREFDESLIMWHIATDLCRRPQQDIDNLNSIVGVTLSEYMLYLLVRQPEMLSATAGIGLLRYRDTCAEARRLFRSLAALEPNHEDARVMLLAVNTSKKPAEVKGDRSKSVLFDACILAKALRRLNDDTMWEVVAGVWLEMLTHAAGKCRGSTHVRQLSRGGEFITLVWFLMAHMGIGEMYRIQEGDAKAKLIVHDQ